MTVLAITTSTPQIGVAIGDVDRTRASWSALRGRHHAELLTPAITEVCRAADVALGDLDAVAVDNGPGLFTGLRIGVATAKALAFALGLPVVAVSSLDVLAFAHRHVDRRITAAVDARRGELFVASYVAVPGGVRQVDDARAESPERMAAGLQAEPGGHLVVGDGAARHADVFAHNDRVVLAGTTYPSAAVLAGLGAARLARGEAVTPDQVRCTYLREPDAEINWVTRDGGVHRGTGPDGGAS